MAAETGEQAEVKEALLAWINVFREEGEHVGSLEELSDGVALFELMVRVAPAHFDVDSIKRNAAGNPFLCASNLGKLGRGIEAFAREALDQPSLSCAHVDMQLISESADVPQLVELVELLLGCVVQCEQAQEYIGAIMQLEQRLQKHLMVMIQSAMDRATDDPADAEDATDDAEGAGEEGEGVGGAGGAGGGGTAAALRAELDEALGARDALSGELGALRLQHEALQRDNEDLQAVAAAAAATQSAQSDAAEQSGEQDARRAADAKKLARAQAEAEDACNELAEATARMEGQQTSLHEKEKEVARQQQQLQQFEDEIRRQAEELDIARSKATQLSKLETQLSKYKQRLEEAGDLRQQIKEVEEQNDGYLQKMLDMESDVKTIPGLKKMLDGYKNKQVDMETVAIEAAANLSAQQAAQERLAADLREANEARQFMEEQLEGARAELAAGGGSGGGGDEEGLGGLGGGGGGFGGGRELKEKNARLEREVRELRAAAGGGESEELRSQLEDEQRVRRRVETAAADSRSKLLELERERDELQQHVKSLQQAQESGGGENAVHEAELSSLQSRVRRRCRSPAAAFLFLAGRCSLLHGADCPSLPPPRARTADGCGHRFQQRAEEGARREAAAGGAGATVDVGHHGAQPGAHSPRGAGGAGGGAGGAGGGTGGCDRSKPREPCADGRARHAGDGIDLQGRLRANQGEPDGQDQGAGGSHQRTHVGQEQARELHEENAARGAGQVHGSHG